MMALDYRIWQGIGALNTYCGVTSAWRSSILFYIALRSKHDYFFAPLEELAKEVGCSHDTAASVMNDLAEIGAVESVPYADLPGWIRKLHPRYNPNKKYWHATGEYTIAGVTYQYKWNGDGGDVVSEKIVDVVSEKIVVNKTIQNREIKETTFVAPAETTVAASTPEPTKEQFRLIYTIGKRGTSKRHYATTPDGYEPLCGGSKRSGKATGSGWGYECTHDLNGIDLCKDCAAIAAGEKPAPTPKAPRLVDMTNAALQRPQPAGLTPDKLRAWLKQKPFADFFANWEVWNRTEGFPNRTLDHYKEHALPDDRKEIYIIASQLGTELERLAKSNNITFTLELLSAFEDWYLDNTFQEKPMAQKKFPTSVDKFRRNILLYLNYLHQLEYAS